MPIRYVNYIVKQFSLLITDKLEKYIILHAYKNKVWIGCNDISKPSSVSKMFN